MEKRLTPWRLGMHFMQRSRHDRVPVSRKIAANIADAAILKAMGKM